jgi:HPt (histidine-containing phosphotransfer) domain-containing protein
MTDPIIEGKDLLDRTVLAELRALGEPGEDLLGDVVREFLKQARTLVDGIAAALDAANAHDAERAAHRLKGSSLSVGARRLAAVCDAVERAARAGNLAAAREAAGGLEAGFASTRTALEREIG